MGSRLKIPRFRLMIDIKADNRLPSRLLDGQACLLGNANRPAQVLHGKAASDHAVQNFEDQDRNSAG